MNFSTTRNSNNSPAGGMTSFSGGSSRMNPQIKYVYDLPFFERKEICRIFDENNQWETLGGGLMGYSSTELSEFGRAIYRGASPMDALLTSWGSQNHTILELFTLCGRLYHFRGMRVLAKFVDPKYHTFIRDPEVNVTAELDQIEIVPPKSPVELKAQNNAEKPPGEGEEKKETNNENKLNLNLASLAESVGSLPQIPYSELLIATDNWERGNIVGRGGFGTVFRGIWKNTAVAIKRMEQKANPAYVQSQLKQSLGELRFLNSYRHDNILPIYGYSLEGEHPCLVYQYMNNGSLEDRLLCRKRTAPLTWTQRYNIIRGVACGIQFLHSIGAKPLIHGDIKSANILLDRNFEAKVGDFGLAREMTPTGGAGGGASYVKVSRVHGTRPYLPDEYLRSKKLSTKVDTFSFGIMSFEIVTGQRAYEENRQRKFLKEIFDEEENPEILKDPKGGQDSLDIFWILVKLGKACTSRLAKDRPEMAHVLKSLDGLMSQASIRTVSSHVTGLPLLFETRPGSLMPIGTSTNHRLSPVEMRTPSPNPNPNSHWMTPQGAIGGPYHQTPKQLLDSMASGRNKSPLSSVPSVPQAPLTPQMTRSQHVSGASANPDQLLYNSNPSNQPFSNPNPNPGNNFYMNNNNPGTHPGPFPMNQLNGPENSNAIAAAINANLIGLSQPPIVPTQNLVPDDNTFPAALDDFLPVFLDKNAQETQEDEESNTEDPTTVIPLITELGIKD